MPALIYCLTRDGARTSTEQPVDGLDRSSLMDRYARECVRARVTSDKQECVQSVHKSPPPDLTTAPFVVVILLAGAGCWERPG
jgi:hypothetical protein